MAGPHDSDVQEPGSALTKEIPLVYAGYRARAGDEKAALWIRLKNRTGEEERTKELSVRWGKLRVRRPG